MAIAKQTAAAPGARPKARPLSPHLSVFRPYINMTMSILHRMTGAANYFGSLLLAVWLIAAATSDEWFNTVNSLLATPIGLFVLFGFSWSVIHHLLGGIRHFIWDTIHGFTKGSVKFLSWFSILLSVGLTGALWMTALSQMGKLSW
jgi:succinate dehydrogenase / fumarate reductase, cytochrome b subunit